MAHHHSTPSNGSISTIASDGTAINWVLDHVLTHPARYEKALPLRTIYHLNSAPQASDKDFKVLLMEHLANLPAQPCTLPPPFLATFIAKCFPSDYQYVDFDQALTALDYIHDLDMRRRKELEKAIRERGPHDKKVLTLRTRSLKVDQFYAKAILGIRQWAMLHELSVTPFNKFNCIALLNTLFPVEEADINSVLTAPILAKRRHRLWKCINAVEKQGSSAITINNDDWKDIGETIETYLRCSVDLVQRAEDLARPLSFGSFGSDSSIETDATATMFSSQGDAKNFSRRGSADTASGSLESSTKRSKLDRIVKGLAKMGMGKKQAYSSQWSGNSEDVKMHFS